MMIQDVSLSQVSNGRFSPVQRPPLHLATGTVAELFVDTAHNDSLVVVKTYNKRTLSQRRVWRSSRSDAFQKPGLLSLLDRYSTFFNYIDLFKDATPDTHLLNILAFYETTVIDDNIDFGCFYLVMEHCENGVTATLSASYEQGFIFERENFRQLPDSPLRFLFPNYIVRKLTLGLFTALHCLHHAGFVHGDVKPTNTFVARNGELKLGDFDLMQRGEKVDGKILVEYLDGTSYFKAPEVFNQASKIDGVAADVWAAGLTLWIWCFAELPFSNVADCWEEIAEFNGSAYLARPTRHIYVDGPSLWDSEECHEEPYRRDSKDQKILPRVPYRELLDDPLLLRILEGSLMPDPAERIAPSDVMELLSA